MRFGIREVADVVLTKKSGNGPAEVKIETAKMSTLEGASTTVYAQGGKGNARLIAWEGEKTLTFTVEDALITLDSFQALTGTIKDPAENLSYNRFISTTTSFAGYYTVEAKTLFRDEDGIDHPALITIPRAKLQTQLNLSMAPSGDPSTFTFTFDAFPDDNYDSEHKDVLFDIKISKTDADILNDKITVIIYDNTINNGAVHCVSFMPVGETNLIYVPEDTGIQVQHNGGADTALTVSLLTGEVMITDMTDFKDLTPFTEGNVVSLARLEVGKTYTYYIIPNGTSLGN